MEPTHVVDVFPLVLEVLILPLPETRIENPLASVALEVCAVPARISRFVDSNMSTSPGWKSVVSHRSP